MYGWIFNDFFLQHQFPTVFIFIYIPFPRAPVAATVLYFKFVSSLFNYTHQLFSISDQRLKSCFSQNFQALSWALLPLLLPVSSIPYHICKTILTHTVPYAQSETDLSERGLVWNRAKNSKNSKNNDETTITDTTITQLTEVNKNSETQLTVLVEKKLVIKKDTRKSKDNVRKNHYSSKNQNVVCFIFWLLWNFCW